MKFSIFYAFLFFMATNLVAQISTINSQTDGTSQGAVVSNKTIATESTYQLICPTTNHIVESRERSWGEIEKSCSLNGVKDGQSVMIYPRGSIARRGQYSNGLMVGEWERFSEAGVLLDRGTWKDSRPEGNWSFWYENGEKKMAGHYRDGEKIGFWDTFDVNIFDMEQKKNNKQKKKLMNFKYRFGKTVEQHSIIFKLMSTKEMLAVTDPKGKNFYYKSDFALQLNVGWQFDFNQTWAGLIQIGYRDISYPKTDDKILSITQNGSQQLSFLGESIYKIKTNQRLLGKIMIEEKSYLSKLEMSSEESEKYVAKIEKKLELSLLGQGEYDVLKRERYGVSLNAQLGYGTSGVLLGGDLIISYQQDLRSKIVGNISYMANFDSTRFAGSSVDSADSKVSNENIYAGVGYVYEL